MRQLLTHSCPQTFSPEQGFGELDERRPIRELEDVRKPGIRYTQRSQEPERYEHETLLRVLSLLAQCHHGHDQSGREPARAEEQTRGGHDGRDQLSEAILP